MKQYFILLFAALAFLSCSDDDLATKYVIGNVSVNVGAKEYITSEVTLSDEMLEGAPAATPRKLQYIIHGNSASVVWGGLTTIGVFPVDPANSQIKFSFEPKADDKIAVFTSSGWALQDSVTYAAYYPYHNLTSDDRYDSVPVSFSGQHQVGNNTFDHISSRYDYMYSDRTKVENGACTFHFQHANALIHFAIIPPVAADWESLTVSSQNGDLLFIDSCYMNVLTGKVDPISRKSSFTIELSDAATKNVGDTLYVNTTQLPASLTPITVCLKSRDGACFFSNFGKGKITEWCAGYMKTYICNPKSSNMLNDDLGLPSGNLWARCNLGALMPEEPGNYMAWGDTEQRDRYFWDTYRFSQQKDGSYGTSSRSITAYTIADNYKTGLWYDASGQFCGDGITELKLDDDPAHLTWGGDWITPTQHDYAELMQYTTCRWDTLDSGCMGYTLTSKVNGNTIFFPAAGYKGVSKVSSTDYSVQGYNVMGYYWTSNLSPNYSFDAIEYKFGIQQFPKDVIYMAPSLTDAKRYAGCSVRAIKPGANR